MYNAVNRSNVFGNNVSHANNKTKRQFKINRLSMKFYSELMKSSLSILSNPSFARTVRKYHGIDGYLINAKTRNIPQELLKLRNRLIRLHRSREEA